MGDDREGIAHKTRLFVSELVSTALLLFLLCCLFLNVDFNTPSHLLPTFGVGLVILLLVQTFGHISGAHMNPCVTTAAVLLGHLDPLDAPVYVGAQFLGAIFGYAGLKFLLPDHYFSAKNAEGVAYVQTSFCCTLPSDKLSSMQAVTIEALATFCLILVCAAVWDKRNAHNTDSVAIRFGMVVGVLAMAVAPLTGCSMNIARSFGPALIQWEWSSQWVYWVGPLAGTLAATALYKCVFDAPRAPVAASPGEKHERNGRPASGLHEDDADDVQVALTSVTADKQSSAA